MIRITRETDYGILLLAQIAQHGTDRSHAARAIAGWVGMSLPMASKILKALSRSGLLASNRGVRGGYSLARPLERISIADVVEAIEGPIGLVDCVTQPGTCVQESCCPTSVNWKRLNDAVKEALGSVTVSEMVDPCRPRLLHVGSGSGS
jgi:FeS assembly SUF system regulator